MSIKELLNELKEFNREFTDCEIYEYTNKSYPSFHTDSIRSVENYSINDIVLNHEIMDQEDYNNTICANSGISADFSKWYDDENAKILVIAIDR